MSSHIYHLLSTCKVPPALPTLIRHLWDVRAVGTQGTVCGDPAKLCYSNISLGTSTQRQIPSLGRRRRLWRRGVRRRVCRTPPLNSGIWKADRVMVHRVTGTQGGGKVYVSRVCVCAGWTPNSLTGAHKSHRAKTLCSQLPQTAQGILSYQIGRHRSLS